MIFVKVDFQRQRLCLKTAICNNFIKHQVQVLLNTEEETFRRFKLALRDVSYGNYRTYEIKDVSYEIKRDRNTLDEINISQINNIDYGFLAAKIRCKKNKYFYLLKAGRDIDDANYNRWIFPMSRSRNRWSTEKICAMLTRAMNDFNFLRMFIQSIYSHPHADRTQLDPLWDDVNDCLYNLLEVEYKTLDPFYIRRQTYRLYEQYMSPFDSVFYEKVPRQKRFLKNPLIQQERIRYSLKLKPVPYSRFQTYEPGMEQIVWEDRFVWNVE